MTSAAELITYNPHFLCQRQENKIRRDKWVLLPLYKSMVRPHLDRFSIVWSLHCVENKVLLKRVQHRFTNMFSDCEERLLRSVLWSLEERQNKADLIERFKMVKGFSAVSWTHFFTRSDTSITRGHNWKLQKTHNQSDIRFHLSSQRSINRWNSLPQEAVDAPNINSFKNQLEKWRHCQMDFSMDWRPSMSYGCTPRIKICQVLLHQLITRCWYVAGMYAVRKVSILDLPEISFDEKDSSTYYSYPPSQAVSHPPN